MRARFSRHWAMAAMAAVVFVAGPSRAAAPSIDASIEPAQIARKLVAVMEARSRGEEGHLFAPGSYVVGMHGDDYERLEPHRSYLEREWSELLREMGARVGIRYEGEPRVSMVPKDGVPRGAVEVSVAGDPGAPAERFEPRGAPVRRYHLRLLKGVSAEDVYPLRPGETMTVGRSTECDVALRDRRRLSEDGVLIVVATLAQGNGSRRAPAIPVIVELAHQQTLRIWRGPPRHCGDTASEGRDEREWEGEAGHRLQEGCQGCGAEDAGHLEHHEHAAADGDADPEAGIAVDAVAVVGVSSSVPPRRRDALLPSHFHHLPDQINCINLTWTPVN